MTYPVPVTKLEKDDRVEALQSLFADMLKQENAYTRLSAESKQGVEEILEQLRAMRFESADGFISVSTALMKSVAPDLTPYLPIAVQNAKSALPKVQGVLVIYTGGTIGSAPKDYADPDSPQVVKPWRDLKNASPRLGALGYPVDAISFVTPLDSCNVGPEHWQTMSGIIRDHYSDYAGFVILHGTDSMGYTSSALAFFLQELSKPVVITGSQLAGIVNARNDAHQNIVTAIMLANPHAHRLPLIPEVVAVFGGKIVRGCRNKKMHVTSFQGFDSPNFPALGNCGDVIEVATKYIRVPSQLPLNVLEHMDTNVIMLEVFPGIQNTKVVERVLSDPNLKGMVLQAYGAGNIPTKSEFLDQFKPFIDRGGVVVVTTMVPAGRVEMGLYETSQVLLDRGLVGAFDITPEAALCKLMILLGTYPDDSDEIKHLMQQSLVGEQSLSLECTSFATAGDLEDGDKLEISSPALQSCADADLIDRVVLRFVDAALKTAGEDNKAIISLALAGQELGPFPHLANGQDVLGAGHGGCGESLAIDLTRHKDLFVSKASSNKLGGRQSVQFSVGIAGAQSAFRWSRAELNIYVRDE